MADQHGTSMTNIPTDLLRTLVAVVDLRSFTKAAHSLGVTQPAVSTQIKRLQYLLRTELLDKSAACHLSRPSPWWRNSMAACCRLTAVSWSCMKSSSDC